MGQPRRSISNIVLTIGPVAVRWLLLAAAASLVFAVVELGLAVFLQLFLKTLGLWNSQSQVTPLVGRLASLGPAELGVGLTVLALIRSVTLFVVQQSGHISMETIGSRLRRLAVWETLLHPAKRFIPAAAVNARVGDLTSKASAFCYAGSVCVSYFVQGAALIFVLFVTARWETVIAMVGLALLGSFVLRVNRAVRRIASAVPRELRVLAEGIERVARNLTLVRVLRTEKVEHRRLATSIDTYSRHLVRASYLANLTGATTPFVGIVLIIVIVGVSQSVLHTPSITLVAFLYLFVRFVQTLSNITHQFSVCNTNWSAFKDCLEYVGSFTTEQVAAAMRVETADERGPRTTGTDGAAPSIEVRSVSFAYPGATTEVLRELSASIEEGSQLAIVGPSGCGKSTFLGLVLGLFEPTRGDIRIGGRSPIEFFSDPSVRVGYVGAESFLIAGTIRENLCYGLAWDAQEEDLWTALGQAELRTTVEGLPGQLTYKIAEDGSGLSAGQRQRLCLARALLNRPHLLVLDEVSANLDIATERAIAESLKTLHGRCTTVLVSHRKGIFMYADRVVALNTANAA